LFRPRPPLFPLSVGLTAGPADPCAGGAPPNRHLPHRKTPPAALPSPSLRARLTDGPHLSSLTSSLPELGRATTTSRRSPCRPALPRMPPELLPPHHHFPLLNPPLITSPPPSMALTPLTPPLLPWPPSLVLPLGPYKRAMRPPTLTAPHPLSPELFCAVLRPRDELKPPPFVASGAPPLRHPSVAGEHLPSTASTGLSSPSIVGEHRQAPAPARR
jgi:hypothetical protein